MSGSDRELLELAAKAAGYQIEWVRNSGCHYRCEEGASREQWCPMDEDGDALRLAVNLSISLDVNGMFVHADCRHREDDIGYFEENSARHNGDMMQATRRAIVRAAAEIGRLMPWPDAASCAG